MLETLEVDGDDVNGEPWFQQDGATTHAAAEWVDCLRVMQPGRIVTGFGNIFWPARSPDFSAPDCFSLATIKSGSVCEQTSHIEDVKQNIRDEIKTHRRAFVVNSCD
jgi:hypothetical protein